MFPLIQKYLNIKKEILLFQVEKSLFFKKGGALFLITAIPISPVKEEVNNVVKLLF